jgi:hypothetical protein
MTSSRAARRRVYVDTSAYLCTILNEDGAKRVSDETDGAILLSSVLIALESRRSLVRLAREGTLTGDQYNSLMRQVEADLTRFSLRDLTLDLCLSNRLPAIATPRSLDLAHLQTALWFQASDPLDRFLTMDDAQRDAAAELGLPV